MELAKRLADLLTASRVLIALLLTWLGLAGARDSLALASFLLLFSWISDIFDGALARLGGSGSTWIGDHDLEADVTVSLGVLIYLVGAGFLQPNYAVVYVLLWSPILLALGLAARSRHAFSGPNLPVAHGCC